jgi:hypothetical protein
MSAIVIHRQTIGKSKSSSGQRPVINYERRKAAENIIRREDQQMIKSAENRNASRKVGTLTTNKGKPVFKGRFGGYYKVIISMPYRNGIVKINVPKNQINFNQKFLNNRAKPQGKWWWSRLRSKAPNGAPVYKNTITGVNANSSGNRVNKLVSPNQANRGNNSSLGNRGNNRPPP